MMFEELPLLEMVTHFVSSLFVYSKSGFDSKVQRKNLPEYKELSTPELQKKYEDLTLRLAISNTEDIRLLLEDMSTEKIGDCGHMALFQLCLLRFIPAIKENYHLIYCSTNIQVKNVPISEKLDDLRHRPDQWQAHCFLWLVHKSTKNPCFPLPQDFVTMPARALQSLPAIFCDPWLEKTTLSNFDREAVLRGAVVTNPITQLGMPADSEFQLLLSCIENKIPFDEYEIFYKNFFIKKINETIVALKEQAPQDLVNYINSQDFVSAIAIAAKNEQCLEVLKLLLLSSFFTGIKLSGARVDTNNNALNIAREYNNQPAQELLLAFSAFQKQVLREAETPIEKLNRCSDRFFVKKNIQKTSLNWAKHPGAANSPKYKELDIQYCNLPPKLIGNYAVLFNNYLKKKGFNSRIVKTSEVKESIIVNLPNV